MVNTENKFSYSRTFVDFSNLVINYSPFHINSHKSTHTTVHTYQYPVLFEFTGP